MKKRFLILLLLPMVLFGLKRTMIPDYSITWGNRVIKGDSSGVAITANTATDSCYVKYIEVGKYNLGSLFLYGNIDSMVIYKRSAPTSFELVNTAWDSICGTAETDTVYVFKFSGMTYAEYMDLMIICKKKKAAKFRWYIDFGL